MIWRWSTVASSTLNTNGSLIASKENGLSDGGFLFTILKLRTSAWLKCSSLFNRARQPKDTSTRSSDTSTALTCSNTFFRIIPESRFPPSYSYLMTFWLCSTRSSKKRLPLSVDIITSNELTSNKRMISTISAMLRRMRRCRLGLVGGNCCCASVIINLNCLTF